MWSENLLAAGQALQAAVPLLLLRKTLPLCLQVTLETSCLHRFPHSGGVTRVRNAGVKWRTEKLTEEYTMPSSHRQWAFQGRERYYDQETVGWHHRPNGHEFEQTSGDSEGQRSLAYYHLWNRKESEAT